MKYGIATFVTDETLGAAELGRLLEERGFESVWLPEHTHIPVRRETPYPGGTELPREYYRSLDPFVCLTAIAAATERLVLGTAVCLIGQHDPLVLAKTAASLDRVSGGRLQLGIGAGWNREEMRNHGVDPKRRIAVMREKTEAVKALWTEDEASYEGEHVQLEPVFSYPKPAQPGGPPVLIGGHGPTVEQRVLGYADAWMPRVILDQEDELLARVRQLLAGAAEQGRQTSVSLYMVPARPEHLERYREAGVERCIFYVNAGDRPAVERRLDQIAAVL